MSEIKFEALLIETAKLPLVKVDREIFLRQTLKGKYSTETVNCAVTNSPAYAGIEVAEINKLAISRIDNEVLKVTGLSALSGLPGGFAMLGTIPADLTQYFAHTLIVLQKLVYLYGWPDLNLDSNSLDDETKNKLILFLGVMFGVTGAVGTVNKLGTQVAAQVAKKLLQKALTKGTIYPIVKKIATLIGVKMTKERFAKHIAKVVPILGAVASGGITYISFKPMAKNLMEHLSTLNLASVEYYKSTINNIIFEGECTEV